MSDSWDALGPNFVEMWASMHHTHPLLARAILALAEAECPLDTSRMEVLDKATLIWEDPSQRQLEEIQGVMTTWLVKGLYSPDPDGLYAWGDDVLVVGEGLK